MPSDVPAWASAASARFLYSSPLVMVESGTPGPQGLQSF